MKAIIALIAFLLFLHFASPSFAATFTFSGAPSNISDTESFSLQVSFSIGSSPGTNYYIRAAFSHPDSPTNYLGYTKNNSGSWYNGTSDHTQYYQITLDENSQWSGTIEVKPDTEDSGYKGSGTYNFKLGRYTEAGSGPTWRDKETSPCSIASISITSPTPTPVPPTSTPVPPTSTQVPATATSKPNTPTPTTKTPTPTLQPSPTKELLPTDILGESTESALIISPTNIMSKKNVLVANKSKSPDNNMQKLLMFLGIIVFFSACGIVAFREIKKRRLSQNE